MSFNQLLRWRMLGQVLCLAALVGGSAGARASESVTIQLRWDHQFQFAGYYAADWMGFYEEAGIDAEIRSGFDPTGRRVRVVDAVANGDATFGVGSIDVLKAIDQGADLTIVTSVFQQSGTGIFTINGLRIDSLDDLLHLRVGRDFGGRSDMELRAMLLSEGIRPTQVSQIHTDWYIGQLLTDEIEVYVGHVVEAIPWAEANEVDMAILRPSAYGIDFYGDAVFTRRSFAVENADLVDRFEDATLRGWEYAIEHPDEIASRIATLPRRAPLQGPFAYNQRQAGIIKDLMLYPVVQVGHTNPHRWHRNYEFLESIGEVSGTLDMRDHVFNAHQLWLDRRQQLTRYLQIGMAAAVALAVAAAAWILALREAVLARTRALAEARDRAELASRAKSEFLGNVSHELRTPLNAILGFSEILKEQLLGPIGSPRYVEYADDINKSGTHLLGIVNELLDIARIEAGRMHLSVEPLDLGSEARRTLDIVRGTAFSHQLILEDRIPANLPPVLADSRALRQILLNLLSNAIKFTPEGGRITLDAHQEGTEWITVSVRDTGVGISPENLRKVTEPFTRVENQFVRSHEGTGLGLPIARLLTEGLRGSIALESEVGVGTAVHVSLLLAPAMPAEPAKPEEPALTGLPASGAA